MRNIIFILLLSSFALKASAQKDQLTNNDLANAGKSLEKFATDQNAATVFYVIGGGLTLIGAYYNSGAGTSRTNGLLILGPIATGIGWIIDRSSYKHLKKSGLYLQGAAQIGTGIGIGYKF